MLVLSRYRDESIYIGDDVIVTIVDVRGDRVRLGISAPSNVSVHRQEIYDVIIKEREASGEDGAPETRKKPTEKADKNRKRPAAPQDSGKAPLSGKLAERKGKGLPVDIDTPSVGFGGISDVISQ